MFCHKILKLKMPRRPTKPLFVAEEYYALETLKERVQYNKTHRRLTPHQDWITTHPPSRYASVQQKKWVLITPKKEPLGDSLEHWLIDSVIYHEDEMSITYVLFFKDRIRAASKFRSMCYEWTFIPHTKYFE